MYHRLALSIRSITALFWLGFFMAISFMEAPIKFSAPGLSMVEGLQIGKIVFKILNTCEWIFLFIILTTCVVKKTASKGFYLISTASIILISETYWLLPILNYNADKIIRGGFVINHSPHWIYILLEIIKVPILLLIGIDSGKALVQLKGPT